jgi:hypothetical protein
VERSDRDAAIAASERAIDAMQRDVWRIVSDATRARGPHPMTTLDRILILRAVDDALDGMYGRFPGDAASPLADEIVDSCIAVRRGVWRAMSASLMARLRRIPRLLRAVESDQEAA